MGKTIAFRVDASSEIGSGHFMRSLSLADELIKQGMEIYFISRSLPEYLKAILNQKNIENLALPEEVNSYCSDELTHSNWLKASQEQDAKVTIQALFGKSCDWLVVDHYALDNRWERAIRNSVKKIMVIDDLADRLHDCDILLDQNYYVDMQNRYNDKAPEDCKLLLGPQFALLREEFRAFRKQAKVRNGKVNKILVFFGGGDVGDYIFQVIETLSEINPKPRIDFVIGAQNSFKESIGNACAKHGFVCHLETFRMAELMYEADLAIGAGGSASWERCCLGLPSLLVALADNQIAIAKALSSINACVYIGNGDEVSLLNLKQHLTKLLATPKLVEKMSENAFSVSDGLGVYRVINKMSACL